MRHFFDSLVSRHAVLLNPAALVRGERLQVIEGKTPEIGVVPARRLLRSIDTCGIVGLRDRAIVGILIYTAVRVGAVASLQAGDFYDVGTQVCLRFSEKGGKSREIPCRHDLQLFLQEYLTVIYPQSFLTTDKREVATQFQQKCYQLFNQSILKICFGVLIFQSKEFQNQWILDFLFRYQQFSVLRNSPLLQHGSLIARRQSTFIEQRADLTIKLPNAPATSQCLGFVETTCCGLFNLEESKVG